MKRREFLKMLGMAAGQAALGGFLPSEAEALPAKGYRHVLLLSDLHLPWREKAFPAAEGQQKIWEAKKRLRAAVNAWKDVDEIALLGDLAARYGREEEFACVDRYLGGFRKPWHAVAGNHDYIYADEEGEGGKLKHGTRAGKREKLLAFTKRYRLPGVYYARSIGRYRLLYLAPDACGRLNAEMSPEQLAWMEKEISAHRQGSMIFFFHAPLQGTLRPYKKYINSPGASAQPADRLAAVLAECPKGSIWASGHTHTPPGNDSFADDSVNRFSENLVNIHNPAIDSKHICTNSLYLYPDRIKVRTWDHAEGRWLENLDREYKA